MLINNLTSKNLFQLDGGNANLKIIGETGEIPNLCQLGWFEWCYFRDRNNFPCQEERLSRCLGPAANYSDEISQYILKNTMYITVSHTVRSLTSGEDRDLNIIREKEQVMIKCRSWHGNKLKVYFNLMVETLTSRFLERQVIYLICVNLAGLNGVTFVVGIFP